MQSRVAVIGVFTALSLLLVHSWSDAAFHALHSALAFTISAMICMAGVQACRSHVNPRLRALAGSFAVIAGVTLARLAAYLWVPAHNEITGPSTWIVYTTLIKRLVTSGALITFAVSSDAASQRRAWAAYAVAAVSAIVLVGGVIGSHVSRLAPPHDLIDLSGQSIVLIAALCAVVVAAFVSTDLEPHVRTGLSAAAAMSLIANALFILASTHGLAHAVAHVLSLLAYLTVFVSIMLRTMLHQEQSAHADLRATQAERDRLLARLLSTQEDERRNLSHELHDIIGQPLTRLTSALSSADLTQPDAALRIAECRELAAASLAAVRSMAQNLRPPALDDIGLLAALQTYMVDIRDLHSIEGNLTVFGAYAPRLTPDCEATVYRVVAEALTNIVKHSGANRYDVIVDLRGPQMSVIIEDSGVGFDPAAIGSGLGLLGMSERMARIGGSLAVESSPGAGTTVRLRIARPRDGVDISE